MFDHLTAVATDAQVSTRQTDGVLPVYVADHTLVLVSQTLRRPLLPLESLLVLETPLLVEGLVRVDGTVVRVVDLVAFESGLFLARNAVALLQEFHRCLGTLVGAHNLTVSHLLGHLLFSLFPVTSGC